MIGDTGALPEGLPATRLDIADSQHARRQGVSVSRVTISNLVGHSPAFLETVRLIQRIAETDAPVLIEGETGTGKEVAARAIHYCGARCDRPFVPVNCGAIPESLVENELFGHVRGAYTDAREPQQGLVALANGGTLFLDEVDALSAKGQVTLLRFLQDLNYRPLGSRREERADVRIIAATNANLLESVEARDFRADLYYRLQILNLRLPPLRERLGDPQLLAQHFLRSACQRYRRGERALDPASLPALDTYPWPGNVRELETLIQREVLLTDSPVIHIHPLEGQGGKAAGGIDPAAKLTDARFQVAKARAIAQFERAYITELLARTRGNISQAARVSGKERSRLGKLVKKYGLERDAFLNSERGGS
jgi:DNA-binding NtrC family response regulator